MYMCACMSPVMREERSPAVAAAGSPIRVARAARGYCLVPPSRKQRHGRDGAFKVSSGKKILLPKQNS